jgi:predicted Zn-dependent protease
VQLALLDSAEGNTDAALATADRLRAAYPESAAPDVLEGEIRLQGGDVPAAIAAFERGYAKQPSAEIAIRAHFAAMRNGGDRVDLLENWLTGHPDDVTVRQLLAEHRQQAGDDGGAIDEYERMLEVNADNAVALNNMAYLLHEKGDPRAEELARRALTLRPELPPIQDTLGWILISNGNVEEGRQLLESAHAAAPDDPDIAYHLAVALEKSGEPAKSSEILRALLAGDRTFDSRADAERLLAEISGR